MTGQERLDLDGHGTTDRIALNIDPGLNAPGAGGTSDAASLTAYLLLSDSAMRDAGLSLFARFGMQTGTRDMDGTSIPENELFDVGADEWASA